jgi:chromosome segregation ATPase
MTQLVSSAQSQHESMRDSSIQRLTKELSEIKNVLQEKTTTIRTLKESLEEYKDSQDKQHRQINDIKARMDQLEQQNSLLGRQLNNITQSQQQPLPQQQQQQQQLPQQLPQPPFSPAPTTFMPSQHIAQPIAPQTSNVQTEVQRAMTEFMQSFFQHKQ